MRGRDQRKQEVKELIGKYFRTWSNKDMKGYDDCFLANASIQYIDARGGSRAQGESNSSPARRIITATLRFARRSTHESIDIHFEAKLARRGCILEARCRSANRIWLRPLHPGPTGRQLAIVNLVFYPSPNPIAD